MKTTKIGILGSGDVGQSLGRGFAALGHQVKIGSRDAKNETLKAWVDKTGANASQGTFADAAKFGEVLVLATLWPGTLPAIELAGKESFKGKVLIDATNPLKIEGGRPTGLALGHTDSGGEQVQRWLPEAKVVKAFNSVGHAHMFKPDFPGGPPDMFFAGNDEGAKRTVSELLSAFGWNAVDIGGIDGARLLEPLCWLWVTYAFRTGGWNHALKMLKK
jgi:predicted dinucleotide-binding enzyme